MIQSYRENVFPTTRKTGMDFLLALRAIAAVTVWVRCRSPPHRWKTIGTRIYSSVSTDFYVKYHEMTIQYFYSKPYTKNGFSTLAALDSQWNDWSLLCWKCQRHSTPSETRLWVPGYYLFIYASYQKPKLKIHPTFLDLFTACCFSAVCRAIVIWYA